jgi:hypothetical protein
MIGNGVYSVPIAFSAVLTGEYRFTDESGALHWVLKNGDSSGWNLSRYFKFVDAGVSDYLVLLFSPQHSSGVAYLGTRELLLNFSENDRIELDDAIAAAM